jgi:hypothetical protein
MLEDKEQVFEVGKVVAFRILTGDEIIGEITSMDKESITIKKPCGLQIQPQTGQVALAPATMLGDPDKPVAYQRSAIVARMTPRVDAVESYEEWASDIALIKKDGLVLPK